MAAHRVPSVALRGGGDDSGEGPQGTEARPVAGPVLAFDTSGPFCAACLLLPDGRVILREEAMAKGQAERLVPMLEEVLAEGGIGWRDLARIAVGTGPGNFTGVRIAVAAARGLALGLGVPAVGVTRLEALALGLPRPCRVVEDARGGLAYVQDFPGGAAALVELAGCLISRGPKRAALRVRAPCPRPCRWPRRLPGSGRPVPPARGPRPSTCARRMRPRPATRPR